ncbi:uncharacterized protein TNCV_3756321 [Trichonephila clavipes]|nr:uncharacterized protein TNCV_3756321 [Trichonephila clavipes]
MTSDSLHTGTRIILYQIRDSCLFVWRSYSSLTFICVLDKGSAVRQSLAQACKEGVAGSVPEVKLSVQPLCIASIAISGPVCLMHNSELSVRVTFSPTTSLMAGEMIFNSERGSKRRVCACTVI